MKKINFVLVIGLVFVLTLVTNGEGSSVEASDNNNLTTATNVKETPESKEATAKPFLNGNEPSYKYWMQSGKSNYYKTTYGKWTNKGGALHGPGTMKKHYGTKTSVSVSAGIPKTGLSANLGKEYSISTDASRKIPNGKKGQFQVRNVYKYYKVKMQEWISIDGRKSKTSKSKTVTVKKKTGVESRITLK